MSQYRDYCWIREPDVGSSRFGKRSDALAYRDSFPAKIPVQAGLVRPMDQEPAGQPHQRKIAVLYPAKPLGVGSAQLG